MKWYKHDTDAGDDPKIVKLVGKFGGNGYMAFFRTIEIIGAEIDTIDTKAEWGFVPKGSTMDTLAARIPLPTDEYKLIIKYCDELGLFEHKNNRLFCPKILDRLAEWQERQLRSLKGSRVTHERLGSHSRGAREGLRPDEIRLDEIRQEKVEQQRGSALTRSAQSQPISSDPFTAEERSRLEACDLRTEEGRIAYEKIINEVHIRHNNAKS